MSVRTSTRTIRKASSAKKHRTKNITTTSDDSKDDDSGSTMVPLAYDVLRIIFADLSVRDLCNASMVSRLWREAAGYELKRRKLITGLLNYSDSFVDCSSKLHFSCEITNKPMLGLFFNHFGNSPPKCLGKHLPRSCVSVTVVNYGVIRNDKEWIENENQVAYTLLPDDPKVDIELVVATSTRITHVNKKMDKRDISQPHRTSYMEQMIMYLMKHLKDFKCMIILTSEQFRHSEKLCSLNVFKDNVKVAWGGVAYKLFVCRTNKAGIPETQEALWLIMSISGPNVKCWSTVVDDKVKDEDSVMTALLALKDQVKLQRHTIGFMFACISRGIEWYNGKPNVESTIFRNVFPEIPLVGSIGNGEYGIRSQIKCPFNEGLDHQYSTTFMILTYG